MRRLTLLLASLLLVGCGPNLGLDGNIPLEEARTMPPSDLVQAAHADAMVDPDEVVMDGKLWVPWERPVEAADEAMRSVGTSHGVTIFARSWDRAPHDALFAMDGDGRWQPYAQVIGRAGALGSASH